MRAREASPDAFVFASTRIRALECGLIGTERMERLLLAGDLPRCVDLLEEFGVEVIRDPENGEMDRERTLEHRLQRAYQEVLSLTENADFLKLWLYPYDCNNLKAMIKCHRRGVSAEGMLFDFGTIPLALLETAVQNGTYEDLPAPFGAAGAEAAEALSATADPRRVDLILDAACYEGMLRSAASCGVAFALTLVRERIDLINLLTALRRLRSPGRRNGTDFPSELFLEGGTLTYGFLSDLCRGGEGYFWERISYSSYEKLAFGNRSNPAL